MSVKIKKIKIDIDGKVLELTKRQAVELKDILEEMYGKKEVDWYVYPYRGCPDRRWPYAHWTYTDGKTTSDTLYLNLSNVS